MRFRGRLPLLVVLTSGLLASGVLSAACAPKDEAAGGPPRAGGAAGEAGLGQGGEPGEGGRPGSVGGVGGAPVCSLAREPALVDAAADDPRRAIELSNEAGFIEVPGHGECSGERARMFYSFRPAEAAPATKPLLVLFNGGPGFPSSLGLLPYGTGPKSLHTPEGGTPEDAVWEDNPYSLTSFANVLYIDERDKGLSYLTGEKGPSSCAETGFSRNDAADFIRVILGFLEAHEALMDAKVVLLGESYGGFRALTMLDTLIHHTERAGDELAGAISAHFRRAFPGRDGELTPSRVAEQFGHFVGIQPALFSRDRPGLGACTPIPKGRDPYNVLKPEGYSELQVLRALALHAELADTDELFGVPLTAVDGLAPFARSGAFRATGADDGVGAVNDALELRLGELEPEDAYFGLELLQVNPSWGAEDEMEPIATLGAYVQMFVTNAGADGAVCVPHALEHVGFAVRTDLDGNEARPGRAVPTWDDACGPILRVPTYETAGHDVATTHAREFTEDLESWLRNPDPRTFP
jgi:hypothetical protein